MKARRIMAYLIIGIAVVAVIAFHWALVQIAKSGEGTAIVFLGLEVCIFGICAVIWAKEQL